jgi:hypothetical protein
MRNRRMPLLQGGAYSEFIEEFDGIKQPTLTEAVRIINEQSEIIVENLNEMKNTAKDRRQTMLYLLEQCILISSTLPTPNAKDRVLFRRVRRLTEKARRLTRRDRL